MRDSIGRRAGWILAATALAACDGADGVTGTGTDQTPRLTNHIVLAAWVGEIDTWDIQAIDLDTNHRIAITNGPAVDQYPSVSPDGSLIAFSRRTPNADGPFGDYQIYVTKPDDSDPRPLTAMSGGALYPAWSPDGSKIAFAAPDADGRSVIWAMASDGSKLEQLTTATSGDSSQPAWSPDGSKIAYVSIPFGGAAPLLNVMNADGSDRFGPLGDPSKAARQPAWSPDGSHIAFSSVTSGGARVISLIRADGSGHIDLTAGPHDAWPSWSPAGSHLAFSRQVGGGTNVISLIRADGSGHIDLTAGPDDTGPSWSPAGPQIAFARMIDHGPAPENFEIAVSTANGTSVENGVQTLALSRAAAKSADARSYNGGGR